MARRAPLWILDDGLVFGGGQRFALRLVEHMHAQGRSGDVCLVCPGQSVLARGAEALGARVHHASFPAPGPRGLPALAPALARLHRVLSRAPREAVIVAGTARCQALAVAALAGRRRRPALVHLMHEQDSSARATARFVHRRTGRVVAVGANAAETYRRAMPGVEVTQVNNFLLDTDFQRLGALRGPRDLGGAPVLGVLGRLIPEKGILEFVEELGASGAQWARLRVGAPPQDPAYVRKLESRIASLGLADRVELAGEVHDSGSFLAGVDTLVVPSIGFEGRQ